MDCTLLHRDWLILVQHFRDVHKQLSAHLKPSSLEMFHIQYIQNFMYRYISFLFLQTKRFLKKWACFSSTARAPVIFKEQTRQHSWDSNPTWNLEDKIWSLCHTSVMCLFLWRKKKKGFQYSFHPWWLTSKLRRSELMKDIFLFFSGCFFTRSLYRDGESTFFPVPMCFLFFVFSRTEAAIKIHE